MWLLDRIDSWLNARGESKVLDELFGSTDQNDATRLAEVYAYDFDIAESDADDPDYPERVNREEDFNTLASLRSDNSHFPERE